MFVTQILVVDDFLPWHRFVRGMFASKRNLQIIAEATDGFEGVQKAEQLQPDLILLDIGLPQLNGIEAARRIRKLCPNSKILIVSQDTSATVVEEALRVGANGYVLKSEAGSELLLAVDAILQGNQFISGRLRPYAISNTHDEQPDDRFRLKGASLLPPQVRHTSRVHEIASYRDEVSFVDGLSLFVEAALKVGNPVIVIATEPHRNSIQYSLQARGWDIARAIREGNYISLDARETLSTFMVNDWPDSAQFFKVASNLIKEAAKGAKTERFRVAACGECAPLLWAQGKAEAALQLERLWDAIARSHGVEILCGYTFTDFRRDENNQIFAEICSEHSAEY
jgi:DNA-binding NarL/FixJ family response regulator